jgi:hypothetical protein
MHCEQNGLHAGLGLNSSLHAWTLDVLTPNKKVLRQLRLHGTPHAYEIVPFASEIVGIQDYNTTFLLTPEYFQFICADPVSVFCTLAPDSSSSLPIKI